jgi:plasmid maintenance system killer protein
VLEDRKASAVACSVLGSAAGGSPARHGCTVSDPPGNRLETLKGDYAGFFSIRVNERYRIVFRFEHGDARDVRIVDYH